MSNPPQLEEDLDDLDDVLEQFSPKTPAAPAPQAWTGRPRTNTRVDKPPVSVPGGSGLTVPLEEEDEGKLTTEFAKELAKEMENLVKELASGAEPGGDEDDSERKKTMRAWEDMLIKEMNAMAEGGDKDSQENKDFQAKIQETLNRLGESDEKAKSEDQDLGSLKDMFSMMKDLDLGEGESDEEVAAMLQGMMGQLMSKEILYDPLKELAEKFPPYLANPPKPLSAEEKANYGAQLACVKKMITMFEDPAYDESKEETVKQVVDMMSEMQSYGTPPEEVMGPLPTTLPECPVQ